MSSTAAGWLDSDVAVADLAKRLKSVEVYCLDTEFHRERTYFPRGWRRGVVDGAIGISVPWLLVLAAVLAYAGGWRPW